MLSYIDDIARFCNYSQAQESIFFNTTKVV